MSPMPIRAGVLLALALVACESRPPRSAPSPPDAGRPPPGFVDAAGLRDGTVVRFDAAPPLRDATVFTDAGVPCRTGSVSGTVCTPRGDTPIAGAEIAAATRSCEGDDVVVRTFSNEAGRFRLGGLAPGPTTVTIRAGNFIGSYPVEIVAGANAFVREGITDKICLEPTSARLAVLSGDYDRIQDLIDGLGFGYEMVCGDTVNNRTGRALLQDWDALAAYDVLFINCATGIDLRASNPETRLIVENLRRFVAEGGSVYVSDLSADFVAAAWPDFVEFDLTTASAHEEPTCCVCGAACPDECVVDPPAPPRSCPSCCPLPNAAPLECLGDGPVVSGHGRPQRVRAVVPSEHLRAYLPAGELEIDFPLGGWVEIEGVSEGVEVLVEAAPDSPLAGRPLMILFQPEPDGGRVAYTSFHNHDQATADMRALLAALIFRL